MASKNGLCLRRVCGTPVGPCCSKQETKDGGEARFPPAGGSDFTCGLFKLPFFPSKNAKVEANALPHPIFLRHTVYTRLCFTFKHKRPQETAACDIIMCEKIAKQVEGIPNEGYVA